MDLENNRTQMAADIKAFTKPTRSTDTEYTREEMNKKINTTKADGSKIIDTDTAG